jgi:hypothetical protein
VTLTPVEHCPARHTVRRTTRGSFLRLAGNYVTLVTLPAEMRNAAATRSGSAARQENSAAMWCSYNINIGDDTIIEPGQAAHKSGTISLRHQYCGVALPLLVRRNSPATRNAADGTSFSRRTETHCSSRRAALPSMTASPTGRGLAADQIHDCGTPNCATTTQPPRFAQGHAT